jgi:hypothetical protein
MFFCIVIFIAVVLVQSHHTNVQDDNPHANLSLLPPLPVTDPLSSAANTSSMNILSSSIEITWPFPLLPWIHYGFLLISASHNSINGHNRLLSVPGAPSCFETTRYLHFCPQEQSIHAIWHPACQLLSLFVCRCTTNCASRSCGLPPLQNLPLLSSASIFTQKYGAAKSSNEAKIDNCCSGLC